MGSELSAIQSFVPDTLQSLLFPSVLTVILIFGILAFFGYRLFRYFLVISGAVLCGVVGYSVITPLLLGLFDPSSVAQFLLPTVLGFLFALVGGLLVNRFVKASVFLFSAGLGFYLAQELALYIGASSASLAFLGTPAGASIFATVIGILLGSVILPYYKIVYIFATSVVGLGIAGYLVADRLHTDGTATFLYYLFVIIGIGVGIYAFLYQLRTNRASVASGDTDEERDEDEGENTAADPKVKPRRRLFVKKESVSQKKPRVRKKRERAPRAARIKPAKVKNKKQNTPKTKKRDKNKKQKKKKKA